MIDISKCVLTWLLVSGGMVFATGATPPAGARPPVEASRPVEPAGSPLRLPVEAAKPQTDEGQNSGGPGTSAREAGAPAPAAEPESDATRAPIARRNPSGIWVNRKADEERPIPVLPTLIGVPLAGNEKPASPPTQPPKELEPSQTGGRPVAPAAAAVQKAADPLDAQVDDAIEVTHRRVLVAETKDPAERPHTPWQIGHGMLAFRRQYVVRVNGEKMNAYDWVATNPVYKARVKRTKEGKTTIEPLTWFYPTPYGARPQKFTGEPYEFEGHPNQFLAFFALSRIPREFEFTIQGKKITFGQMLHNAKMEVNDREEVTWNLWAFAYYFDMNDQWKNAAGEPWSMERLVSTTLRQFSPQNSPCGGCHALFALASARNAYLQAGNRLSGAWTQSHQHLEQHIALARAQQNRDGSFSSNYFKGPQYSNDPSKRISTSGHTLEFLMMALQQNRLKEPWVRSGVAAVARDLVQYQKEPLEVGGMYHAVHALVLYRERTRTEFAAAADVTPLSAEAGKADSAKKN